jgi:thiosulfate/3-mercaptopyruvate sulfurtransferase
MKKLLLLLVLLASVTTGIFAQDESILVSPQWLNDHLKDPNLVLLQANDLEFEYAKEHISGARFLWPGLLAPDSPQGSFNLPEAKQATTILRQLGISDNSLIVLCHVRNGVSVTSRMFLTLENLGLRGQVYFLNGGLEAWKKAGFPVTNIVPPSTKGKFKVKPGTLIVDKDYVLKSLSSPSAVVVDARMKRYYDGDPVGNPRDGHITGAKNIPYPDLLDATNMNMFKPNDQLQNYFTPVIPDKNNEVITYCFIGQTASVVYLAGRILGYNMKLYDGSMEEWSRIDSLPMEVTKK